MPDADDARQSRYRIEPMGSGYRISGDGRGPVVLSRDSFSLRVAYETLDGNGGQALVEVPVGLYEFRRFCRLVAHGLMANWTPHPGRSLWPGSQRWAIRRTEWAVTARLHALWQEMLRDVDPHVLQVQRRLFAATLAMPPLALGPDLYRDRWVSADVYRYRGAAIAVADVPVLGALARRSRERPSDADAAGVLNDPFADDILSPNDDADQCVRLLHRWQALYGTDGHAYRSLNRTLAHLPGGVPARLLRFLALLELPRPLTSRLELLLALCWAETNSTFPLAPEENLRVVLHARPAQILDAMRRAAFYLRTDWSPRRSRDVGALVRFLSDCPHPHRGNLVGLTDRAIGWHRALAEEAMQVAFEGVDPATPTARPPISLPDLPGVIFLDTAGAVVAEGSAMGHCIGSYAAAAVEDECYLFHIEYAGDEASVQVSHDGRVQQAYGPHNGVNNAAAWGRRVLTRWARGFRRPDDGVLRSDARPAGKAGVDLCGGTC